MNYYCKFVQLKQHLNNLNYVEKHYFNRNLMHSSDGLC